MRTALLCSITDRYGLGPAAGVIGQMRVTESEKAQARRLLLKALHENGAGDSTEWSLSKEIVSLRPVVTDLDDLGDHPYGLGDEVLAAMRGNSALDDWLAALPKISKPRKAEGAKGPLPGGPTGLPSVTRPPASRPNA